MQINNQLDGGQGFANGAAAAAVAGHNADAGAHGIGPVPELRVSGVTGGPVLADISMSLASVQRLFRPLPDEMVQWRDDFSILKPYTQRSVAGATNGTLAVSAGLGLISSASTAALNDVWTISGLRSKSATFASISATFAATSGGGATGAVRVGYVGINHFIAAHYDFNTSSASVEISTSGTSVLYDTVSFPVSALPFSLMLQSGANCLSVLIDRGHGWEVAIAGADHSTDMAANLTNAYRSAYSPGFGVKSEAGASAGFSISEFKWGCPGETGVANPKPVTFDDGSLIYVPGQPNQIYITLTSAGFQKSGFYGLHFGVYAYDYVKRQIVRKSAAHFISWGGDCAGKIVYDQTSKVWRLLFSTWSTQTSPVGVVLINQNTSPLEGLFEHAMADAVAIRPSDNTTTNVYDPDVIRIGGVWYISLTESHGSYTDPCVLTTTDWATFSIVARDTANRGFYEGSNIVKIGGVHYFVGGGYNDYRAWSFPACTHIGTVALLHPKTKFGAGHYPVQGPIPHAAIINVPDGKGGSVYQHLTFDSSAIASQAQTWGNFIVAEYVKAGATGLEVGVQSLPIPTV